MRDGRHPKLVNYYGTTADLAGTYLDKRIMLGRFSVETTNMLTTDVLTIQFKGNVSMKVNGTSAGGGTTSQPFFDQTFTYGYVPAPGAIALLGLAGLIARRRRWVEGVLS